MKLSDSGKSKAGLFYNLLVMALALYGISGQGQNAHRTSAFEGMMIDFFAPTQRWFVGVKQKLNAYFEHYVANGHASKQNVELREEVARLKNRIFLMDEIRRENRRLKGLLQFGDEIVGEKVLAQIVSWDSNSDHKVLRVNKGSKHGIKLLSPVVTANGLVGHVFRLSRHFADILSIQDINNRVDVLIQRSRAHGIMIGHHQKGGVIKYVARHQPVGLNDLIITSGLGNIYPKGVKVGRVTRIEKSSTDITQKIFVAPSVQFDRLEEVVILVPQNDDLKKREWKELDKKQFFER